MRLAARLIGSALLLHLILIQPNHPAALGWDALLLFPLELPVILAALVAAGPGRAGQVVRAALTVAIWAVAVQKSADFATFVAYNRDFNAVVDYHLLHASWMLARGTLGLPVAVSAVLALLASLAALAAGLWWACGVWAALAVPRAARGAAIMALVPFTTLAAADIGQARGAWTLPRPVPGAAFTARVGLETVQQIVATRAELARFRDAARHDAMRARAPGLEALGDRDFVIIYVESYGRSSFDNPLYARRHTTTLARIGDALRARGLSMRSGWARAPMVGGQSWLSHGTVASGLWLDTQGRYRALLASPRRTLFHYAQAAGRRTVAVMPAHGLPWPEGAYFGFDAIYNAGDLGYAGKPFNWVTMPDQFTLSAFDRLERDRAARAPLVAQVALVSSHAPWVPVPEPVAWDAVGDGRIFDDQATSGDPPEVVWQDRDRVRAQFRKAIDYSLRIVGAWAERHADDPPLIVLMGDHEPARFVSGVEGFDVPVHVIGPPALVQRLAPQGWAAGMQPDPATPALRMDRMRDLMLDRLSAEAGT